MRSLSKHSQGLVSSIETACFEYEKKVNYIGNEATYLSWQNSRLQTITNQTLITLKSIFFCGQILLLLKHFFFQTVFLPSQVLRGQLGDGLHPPVRREPDRDRRHGHAEEPPLHQALHLLHVPRLHVHRPLCLPGRAQPPHLPRDPQGERHEVDALQPGEEGAQPGRDAARGRGHLLHLQHPAPDGQHHRVVHRAQ